MEVCGSRYGTSNWQASSNEDEDDPFRQLKALSSVKLEEGQDFDWDTVEEESVPVAPQPVAPVDCQISAWTEWSSCSASCGIGWITVGLISSYILGN